MTRQEIADLLRRADLELLRVLWCDTSNVIRAKSIYLPTFLAGLDDTHSHDDLLDRLEHQVTVTATENDTSRA